jgi:hypothetical protein
MFTLNNEKPRDLPKLIVMSGNNHNNLSTFHNHVMHLISPCILHMDIVEKWLEFLQFKD